MCRIVATLFVSLFALATIASGMSGESDLDRLQGTWNVTATESDGASGAKEINERTTFTFAKDKMHDQFTPEKGKPIRITYTVSLDATKKPKTIDLTFTDGPLKGEKLNGIYDIDGDTLKLCMGRADAKRPTEFKAPKGSDAVMQTLKRAKKS